MTKKFTCFILSVIILLGSALPVYALSSAGPSSGGGSYGSGSSGGGGSGGGGGSAAPLPAVSESSDGGEGEEGEGGGDIIVIVQCGCPELDPYETYTPKITSIHNLNALFMTEMNSEGSSTSSSGSEQPAVFYIPTTSDLPFSLIDFVKGLKERNEENNSMQSKFALVYDGFFDSEASFVTVETNVQQSEGSGKVKGEVNTTRNIALKYNDKALQLIGYDLLLSQEKIDIEGSGKWTFTYTAKQQEDNKMSAATAVMDVYKALGIYEYDVVYATGEDEEFDANTSPILSELGFITSQQEQNGFDVSEGKTFVGVTRTNPNLYWSRFQQDCVNMGTTALDSADLSTIYHMNAPLEENTKLNMLQFCNLAVALMNLYGEPAISAADEDLFNRTCATYMYAVPEASKVELDTLKYLIIKGIIKPQDLLEMDWFGGVYLNKGNDENIDSPSNYVMGMLGRIADPESRFDLPEEQKIDPELAELGYMETSVSIANVSDITIDSTNARLGYDYLIEVNDAVSTQFVTPKHNTTIGKSTSQTTSTGSTGSTQAENVPSSMQTKNVSVDEDTIGLQYIRDYGDILLDSKDVKRVESPDRISVYNRDKNVNSVKKAKYYYYGVEEHDGKLYYHFKLNKLAIDAGGKFRFKVDERHYTPIQVTVTTKEKEKESSNEDLDDDENKELIRKYKVNATKNGKSWVPVKAEPIKFVIDDGWKDGGVFDYNEESKSWEHSSFAENGYSEEYVDINTPRIAELDSADSKTIVFYIKGVNVGQTLREYLEKKSDAGEFDWTTLMSGADVNEGIAVINSDTKATVAQIGAGNTSKEVLRVEVTTTTPDAVLSCTLLQSKRVDGVSSQVPGYYKEADENGKTSLLVSVEHLRKCGLLTSFKPQSYSDDEIYVMSSVDYENNIIINNTRKLVIVGNTIYAVNDYNKNSQKFDIDAGVTEEILIKQINGEYYVNYRACLGWAGEYGIITEDRNSAGIMVVPIEEYGVTVGTDTSDDIQYDVAKVNTYLPGKATTTMKVTFDVNSKGNKQKGEGILLSGTYSLASYMLIHSDAADDPDYLFVWHFANVLAPNDKEYKIKKKTSEKAISMFKKLTGIKLKSEKHYRLIYYELDKEDFSKVDLEKDDGLKYVRFKSLKRAGMKAETIYGTIGWVYKPPARTIENAITAYAKYASTTSKKKPEENKLILPIFTVKTGKNTTSVAYGDANVNCCSKDESSDKLKLGCVPAMFSNGIKTGLVKPKDNGATEQAPEKYCDVPIDENTDDYKVWTAPVSLFAQLKGLGYKEIKDISGSTVFYGTSACTVKDSGVSVGSSSKELPDDTKAVISYMASGDNTVYVINEDVNFLDKLLNKIETKLEYILSDPYTGVDWDQFAFGRLINKLDDMSTVVLFFALSVLPRVAMLLFFVIMLLCTIVDVKPWKMFCQKWFDIYSVMTLGHQTVDTINLKHMVLISCWAVALYAMLLDGVLFNFVMWLSEFVIVLYQH